MSSASSIRLALCAAATAAVCWVTFATTHPRATGAPTHIDATAAVPAGRGAGPAQADDVLRVCADANNMPFSNARGEGFENRIAQLIAGELGREVRYLWWPQRRGFVRHTLDAGACDVVIGVPADYGRTTNTAPYYRSTYVFVTRRADGLHIASFDGARLRGLRIGLHTIGDDYANVPPAQALAARGIVRNIRGYPITGDAAQADPPRALIDALARNEIDVAIAWGPFAAWFAQRQPVAMDLTPLPATRGVLPMSFAIAAGVRRGDFDLRDAIDAALARRRPDIERLLDTFGVPRIDLPDADRGGPAPRDETTRTTQVRYVVVNRARASRPAIDGAMRRHRPFNGEEFPG